MSRKSKSYEVVELIQAEDSKLPLEERNGNIHRKTGMQLAIIERIREDTSFKGPKF